MPGGGKKAAFPPLSLHDHDQIRISANDQDRQKKLMQSRGKSLELKEILEKEKNEGSVRSKAKSQPGTSKSIEKSPTGKSDQQKTPTKSEQKALLKLEQQQLKSEQKAQQKLEKEQQKLEKEQQKLEKELLKEQLKLEKEHQKEQTKLGKEQSKAEKESKSQSKICFKGHDKMKSGVFKDNPQLKTQRSVDLSCLKSVESPKPPARKSVDMQYREDLLNTPNFTSSFGSLQLKSKK